MEEHRKKFGENLERIRKSAGITRKQIAEKIGMTEIAYGAYENGLRQPPLEKIFALADFLAVSVSELIGEDSKTTEHKFFDYRIRRATKFAKLAGYSVTPLANGNVELEIPGERKQNENGFSQWNRIIPFKTLKDFVETFETAEEKAVSENITFDSALQSIINDADKIRENTWREEIENFVQEHGAEKLLDLLKKQD